MNNNQIINELFDLSPFNLKTIGSVDRQSIKSNDKILATVNKLFHRSSITKGFADKIEEGIDTGHILIGYEDGRKLEFFKSRWRDITMQDPKKGYLGYFDVSANKIAIVLDSNVNLMGNFIRDIPQVLTHEMLHMASYSLWKPFLLANMKSTLLPFYKSFFSNFNLKINKIKDSVFVEYIVEISKINDKNFYNQPNDSMVYDAWFQLLKRAVGKNEADTIVSNTFALYYKMYNPSGGRTINSSMKTILNFFDRAYNSIGIRGIMDLTLPCQEIMFPSEVVCISNQAGPNNINIKLLNNLPF